jgi:hypothetical protein
MNPDLKDFAVQWLRVALMALVPVVITAFVSMPLSLERHPGEGVAASKLTPQHMT